MRERERDCKVYIQVEDINLTVKKLGLCSKTDSANTSINVHQYYFQAILLTIPQLFLISMLLLEISFS